jgi:DNA-binding NarL/FixJ family response regulator
VNVVELLRDDYGCSEETIREVIHWVAVMSDRDKKIFEKRLAGKSMRRIAVELGLSHPTVSSIISSWDNLQNSLDNAAEIARDKADLEKKR